MRYQYTGSGDSPPEKTVFYGISFTRNHKYVDVTDPMVLKKLENHSCFRVEKPKKARAPKKAKDGNQGRSKK